MINALYIARTGLEAQQAYLNVISNNVANLRTPGFKKGRVNFVDIASRNSILANADPMQSPATQLTGNGTAIASTQRVFSEGALRATGGPLDLAIKGPGFFEVASANGRMAYTRAGRLHIDKEGYLAVADGSRLSADIRIPPDASSVTITAKGAVRAHVAGRNGTIQIGRLDLVRFMNPGGLTPIGNSEYRPTQASGEPLYGRPGNTGLGTLEQGYLEASNVDMNSAMTNLMLAQRAYQLDARVIQVADQVLETINNLRR
ncbi:MAG TPA: flagellar basal-body rod protein FlgG [Gammaproteobacteria bacterium]|nr:flagellar basal-body rod protein FlgG [Gammaproteobacteria bacterium]